MTTENNDSATLGNLYWYLHKGWQTGTQEWEGRQLVGRGGWQQYKSVFASSGGVMYAIDWDGNLWWYRYQRGQADGGWSGRSLVGKGGWAAYKSVFATSDGILYAADSDGNLYWYLHKGWQTGTNDWEGRRLVGSGWPSYASLFATSKGVLYGITAGGDLYWHLHKGWQTGTQEWGGPRLVDQRGWRKYTSAFATSDGVLYGIDWDGNLWWYRHEGWQTGTQEFDGPRLAGQGGWRSYANVFMTSDGVLFAVDNNVASRIKHVVYLMLENRSIDNVLGWLYADGKRPARVIAPPQNSNPDYDGLRENTYYNLDSDGNKQWVTRGTDDLWVPWNDPYEPYEHVNNQLFESESNPPYGQTPTMGGFYNDFYTLFDRPWQIMQTYKPEELLVLNSAARNWAVSDAYFSSVPTQTNCNRAFAATGNSIAPNEDGVLEGWVDNNMSGFTNVLVFNQPTMFNVLEDAGKQSTNDWMIFASEPWENNWCFTRDMLAQLQDEKYDAHFDTIDAFFNRAQIGNLPSFCFLEPKWGLEWHTFGWKGDDYHPPTNLAPGEAFVAKLLNALQSSPSWNETLFVINFDEHGGTYDHVRPPWNAAAPWGGDSPTPTPATTELNFGFDRFGVRVPLILVSPYIEANTVFRAGNTPYDHTSVIATVLTMMGVPRSDWKLGNRVRQAPTFENVLTRGTPRTDKPQFEPSDAVKLALAAGPVHDPPPTELQREIAIRRLRHHLRVNKDPRARPIEVIVAPLVEAKTISELSKALAEALGEKGVE